MTRNIVFDMGQVLIYWNGDHFMELMDVPVGDREALGRELFRETEWVRLDQGTITEEEVIERVSARLPQRLRPYVERMTSHWWEMPLRPMEGMGELVGELKGMGYGVYLLSNASVRLPEYFDKIPGSQYFDGRIVSAEWKLLKPQREIYETLFREYSLTPEECFFIDDSPANIEAARQAGMPGAVFHGDVALLRRALNAAGIPVRV